MTEIEKTMHVLEISKVNYQQISPKIRGASDFLPYITF